MERIEGIPIWPLQFSPEESGESTEGEELALRCSCRERETELTGKNLDKFSGFLDLRACLGPMSLNLL